MKYDEMNDWLFEIENYGTRMERFYEEIDHLGENSLKNYAIILRWLNAAFEAGRMKNDESDSTQRRSPDDTGVSG